MSVSKQSIALVLTTKLKTNRREYTQTIETNKLTIVKKTVSLQQQQRSESKTNNQQVLGNCKNCLWCGVLRIAYGTIMVGLHNRHVTVW